MTENSKSGRRLIVWLGVPFVVLAALAIILMVQNRPPVVHVRTLKMPNPNGWDYFLKAADMAYRINPQGPYSGPKDPGKWTAAELQSFAASEAPALDIMRLGLTEQCMHPPYRPNRPIEYAKFRELARVTAGEALYYQLTAKPGKAVDSLLDAAEIGVVIQRGAPLIGGLVGRSVEIIATRHLEPLLSRLSPPDLARAAKRMEEMSRERVPFGDILVEESRANAMMEAELLQSGNRLAAACDWEGNFLHIDASTIDRVKHSASFAFADKAGMIAENQAYLEALAKEQRGPYTGRSSVPEPNNPLAILGKDSLLRARLVFTGNEAIFAILQTEVALLRYRADHGHYPSNLKDLTPTYLKSAPVDPFGLGKPLKYRPTNGGKSFLLYSLGPDLLDDGGKPIKDPLITPQSLGDIVAGSLSD